MTGRCVPRSASWQRRLGQRVESQLAYLRSVQSSEVLVCANRGYPFCLHGSDVEIAVPHRHSIQSDVLWDQDWSLFAGDVLKRFLPSWPRGPRSTRLTGDSPCIPVCELPAEPQTPPIRALGIPPLRLRGWQQLLRARRPSDHPKWVAWLVLSPMKQYHSSPGISDHLDGAA